MKDFQFMHQSLIKEVAKFENTITSKTMARLGLNYSINYGLSINQLDTVAGIIDKDDNYAKYLWKQNEREAKLIALRIFETQNFELAELDDFVVNISNVELAEQAAMQLFAKQKNVVDIALKLLTFKGFVQLSAYLTISRFAMLNKKAKHEIFETLLEKLLINMPSDDAIFLQRAFAQALLRIALIDAEFAKTVKKSVAQIAEKDESFGNYLQQEVIELIY